jgi:pimeloyl-ACP methyl ester carboxylesterase
MRAVKQGEYLVKTATSADGTKLAYDQFGAGSRVIMISGAFNDRRTTEPLSRALAERFSVFNYDRRGRGDSGDNQPYAVQREIEDVAALIDDTGGTAAVFGYSSGANLALKAAARGLPISKLVLYDPAFNPDNTYPTLPDDLADRLTALVTAGRRGEAVELYQTVAVGIPEQAVAQMRNAPFRPVLEGIAHTLAYDAAIVGDRTLPADLTGSVQAPTLVVCGEESAPFLRGAARAVTDALPNGQLVTLAGQGHDIEPQTTAAVISEFLGH